MLGTVNKLISDVTFTSEKTYQNDADAKLWKSLNSLISDVTLMQETTYQNAEAKL